jgi:hypothetical protein
MDGWVSPRLGIRFDLSSGELQIFGADSKRFLTYPELVAQRDQEQQEAERQRQEAERAQQQALDAADKADRLRAQLRALGIEPES